MNTKKSLIIYKLRQKNDCKKIMNINTSTVIHQPIHLQISDFISYDLLVNRILSGYA